MGFMKKGNAVAPAVQVNTQQWGHVKKASVNTQEEEDRKAAGKSVKK